MKKTQKNVCCLIAALFAIACVGCAPTTDDSGKVNPSVPSQEAAKDTEYDLVKDGKSSYRILLPSTPTDTETYAAGELSLFFKEATGCELAVVYDSSVDADKNGSYLSVGDTTLFEKSKVNLSLAELGDDGFKVVTYGNCVIMNGAGECGKLYSVYDFLEEQFSFEVYAADEIYIEQTDSCKLKDYSIQEIPDFSGRDAHNVSYEYNAVFATRKRMRGVLTQFSSAQGDGSVWSRTLYCHSTQILLRPSVYMAEHPDWFSKNGLDLCYGTAIEDSENGRLMRQAVLESLKYYIEAQPTAKYFMIGLEDNSGSCGCEKCTESRKLYGGESESLSGPMLMFVNMIAKEVKAWLKETAPERAELVKICMFAYQASEYPPVTWNEKTQKYEYRSELKPEDNVMVRLAPLSAVYSKTLLDEEANKNIREVILGWSAIGADLSVWSYSCPFGAYLYPSFNWDTLQENYRIFLDVGVTDILDQGPRDSDVLPFHDLRNYLQAELMWDVDSDLNCLIDDFMNRYYKDAAPFMKEYFNLVQSNYALMEKTKGYLWYVGPWESRDNVLAEYYPKSYLNQCLEIFDRAYAAIEQIEDEQTKALVLTRVQQEELSPRYIDLEHYKSYYDESTLRKMFTEFQEDAARFGLSYYAENALISSKYQNWWNSLS